MEVGLEVTKIFFRIPIQTHLYKFTQQLHPCFATTTIPIWDLPEDVFRVLASNSSIFTTQVCII
jgi:hypothetical protein